MKLNVKEVALFGMLGALTFALTFAMKGLPNIEPVSMFIIAITVVFRFKALYPIYVYVMLEGIYMGFSLWWVPYLWIWAILWGIVMLLPKKMPIWLSPIVYCAVSGLFGLSFGTLWAPFQMVVFNLGFDGAIKWIIAGFPWDVAHAIGNVIIAILTLPMIMILKKAVKIISK